MNYLNLPTLVCALAAVANSADAQTCPQLSKTLSEGWQRDVPCYCKAEELARVRVKLPKGLKLHAVCALRSSDGRFVNLTHQSVDMNRYDKTGNTLDGEFYLSGALSLSGSIRVEPGNSGDLWFTPDVKLGDSASPFGSQLSEFKLDAESHYRDFKVTPAMLQLGCSQAKASAIFNGLLVSLGETDFNGAHARKARVLKVGNYHTCAQR